jgi:VWFA-related protein
LLGAILAGLAVIRGAGQEPETPEVSTTSSELTLKVERNEVPVRVVVRDAQGHSVRNLTKDDFQILDDGKPQAIVEFSAESSVPAPVSTATQEALPSKSAGPLPVANRFVALYFDDNVMDFEDIARTRDAASKYLQTSIRPGDRVAIYTSSGRFNLDFTQDRAKLQEALSRLSINPLHARVGLPCFSVSDYEAYRIEELHDSGTLRAVAARAAPCVCPIAPTSPANKGEGGGAPRGSTPTPEDCPAAQGAAESAAHLQWAQGEKEVIGGLHGLEDLVRRISVMPGQRSIVFVSPGFISESQYRKVSEIVSRAVRAGVVINALDSRGLYAGGPSPVNDPHTELVLADLAGGTGGAYFHNNNDFDAGFRATGGLPEYSYVLVFSPSDVRFDGKYHRLTVQLIGTAASRDLRVQARKGYFAPQTAPGSPQAEQEKLLEAVYSRDEVNPSRVRVGTRFFKSSPTEAHLTIVAHLDPQGLTFRKENDRNVDNVTFATAVFDNDGYLVKGVTNSLEMHLREATLVKLRAAGVSVPTTFTVAPGTYRVRVVVSDANGLISCLNSDLEIP